MKERMLNNLWLKLLSIFLAFLVWLAVVNVSNPEVTRTKEVTLEIVNGEVLSSAGKTYEIGKNTVTVSYNVRTTDVGSIRASDFRAYIDMADLYDVTGSVPVIVEVLNNKELISDPVAKPGVVRVVLEDLQRKPFELTVNPIGTPEDGYAVGSVTLTPETILVTGPVSAVGQISTVGIEFETDGVNADLIGIASPVFYDANGNKLNLGDRVATNVKDISYEAQILKVKDLAIDFQIDGEVADGFRLTGVDSNVKAITVAGAKSVLASVSTITIPSSRLDINGANASKTVTVDISEYLPPGVSLVDAKQKDITVVLRVEPLKTRKITMNVSQIIKKGAAAHYDYQFQPQVVEVTVGGLADELAALKAEDLHPEADLTGLTEGTSKVELHFASDARYHVESYTPVEVKVAQLQTEPATTEPEESSTSTTGAAEESSTTAGPVAPGTTGAGIAGPDVGTEAAATVTGEHESTSHQAVP